MTKQAGLLSDISKQLPATERSHEIQHRAAQVNLDWPTATDVLDATIDELEELREAIASGDLDHAEAELGDVIFGCVNLARHMNLSFDKALNRTNDKFIQRFEFIERKLAEENRPFDNTISFNELLDYWNQAKKEERNDK
jgi:uncharacterized protein YabN with tetrapyrrole methylase and pyrophosphatase domain